MTFGLQVTSLLRLRPRWTYLFQHRLLALYDLVIQLLSLSVFLTPSPPFLIDLVLLLNLSNFLGLLFEVEQLAKVFKHLVHFLPFFLDLYSVLLLLMYVYAVCGMAMLGGKVHYQVGVQKDQWVLMNFNDLAMGLFNMFHLMYKGWD